MKKRAAQERSGVHSSATVPLALYSDPIVARNTSACDFRISDLMQADPPASLYLVIPPHAIKRLRPLIRILLNQFPTRLPAEMDFEGGRRVNPSQLPPRVISLQLPTSGPSNAAAL